MYKRQVLSGVPQESVLGPLLFVVYVNDLGSKGRSRVLKFADDTKLIRSVGGLDDCMKMQRDLDIIDGLGKKWQMARWPLMQASVR